MGDLSRCKLHECAGCGHLYQVMVTACDCMSNPENIYREWTAIPSGEFNKLMSAPGGDAVESERAANAQLTAELEALRQERDGLRADAVRYRWLREKVENRQLEIAKEGSYQLTTWCNDYLDGAIDADMAKEQGDGA